MDANQPKEKIPLPPLGDSKGEASLYSVVAKSEHEIKSRKWVVPTVLFLTCVSIAAAAWIGTSLEGPVQKLPTKADIGDLSTYRLKAKAAYVEGKVARNGSLISEGQEFEEGDLVESNYGAKIVLLFDDGSVVRIGENSRVVLQLLKTSAMVIDDKKGVVYARINKSDKHKFYIVAGTITVESTGTAFAVENKGDVKVNVFESEVKITEEGRGSTQVAQNQEWNTDTQIVSECDKNKLENDQFIQWSLKEDNIGV
jgi:hypothetical protein